MDNSNKSILFIEVLITKDLKSRGMASRYIPTK